MQKIDMVVHDISSMHLQVDGRQGQAHTEISYKERTCLKREVGMGLETQVCPLSSRSARSYPCLYSQTHRKWK